MRETCRNQLAGWASVTCSQGEDPRRPRASTGLAATNANSSATARRSSLTRRGCTGLPTWRRSASRVIRVAGSAVQRRNAAACSAAAAGSPRMSPGSSKPASQLSKRHRQLSRSWLTVVQRSVPASSMVPRCHLTASRSQGREAVKWHLGTMLEAGTLRWTTVSQERLNCLCRFDNWLAGFDDPGDILGDPAAAAEQAAAFRRWTADPANRMTREADRRHVGKPVHPPLVNDDLRAVAELLAFVAANPVEARGLLGSSPWEHVTEAHPASWFRQVSRIPHQSTLNDRHYVDDHALAQIPAALPLLGLAHEEQLAITRGDGRQVLANGFDDPQAMRMILLQILTGRRASEIRTCEFDCLSPAPDRAVAAAAGADVVRFRYAQSKIDIAPDSILVDLS